MNIAQLKEKLNTYKSESLLKDQTVEMVLAGKKHFFTSISKSVNEAIIVVKRKDYSPYSINQLEALLNEFNDSAEIFLAPVDNIKSKSAVTNCFLTDVFLELEA